MECHKCPYNQKGDAACIGCAANRSEIPLNHHGKSEVSIDAIEGTHFEPRTFPEDSGGDPGEEFLGVLKALPPESAEALADFLQRLFAMDCRDFRAIGDRYRAATSIDARPTLEETGRAMGMTKQAAACRLGNALAYCPEIRAMFPRMRRALTKTQKRIEAAVLASRHGAV